MKSLAFNFIKLQKHLFSVDIIKCKYLIRDHFRRNFSSKKDKENVNVEIEIEKPESNPMISVSKLNLVK